MGTWKKKIFKNEEMAVGFVKGLEAVGKSIAYPKTKKMSKGKYSVEYKDW